MKDPTLRPEDDVTEVVEVILAAKDDEGWTLVGDPSSMFVMVFGTSWHVRFDVGFFSHWWEPAFKAASEVGSNQVEMRLTVRYYTNVTTKEDTAEQMEKWRADKVIQAYRQTLAVRESTGEYVVFVRAELRSVDVQPLTLV